MSQLASVGLALLSLYSHGHYHKLAPPEPPTHTALASWYYDGGQTACGYHAFFGVANRTLACGTKVTFYTSDKAVKATVDDRGPYIYDRLWDLNQNVAGVLGFSGVGLVRYRLGW